MRGFSLVELVTVLLLVTALSVVAYPSLRGANVRAPAFAEELRAAVRFARAEAIASGCPVRVRVDAGTDRYRLDYTGLAGQAHCPTPGGAGAVAVPNPVQSGAYAGVAPSGVDITAGLDVTFDALGGTLTGGTAIVAGRSINVESTTGYVQ